MKRKVVVFVALAVCGMSWDGHALAGPSCVIIINQNNPVNEISVSELKAIYRQKKKVWDWGGVIKPVNQKESSKCRKTFTKDIFNKKPSTMEAYYLKRALSGKGRPPRTLKTDKDVLHYVASHKGVIGYVTKADDTVKTLNVK